MCGWVVMSGCMVMIETVFVVVVVVEVLVFVVLCFYVLVNVGKVGDGR